MEVQEAKKSETRILANVRKRKAKAEQRVRERKTSQNLTAYQKRRKQSREEQIYFYFSVHWQVLYRNNYTFKKMLLS